MCVNNSRDPRDRKGSKRDHRDSKRKYRDAGGLGIVFGRMGIFLERRSPIFLFGNRRWCLCADASCETCMAYSAHCPGSAVHLRFNRVLEKATKVARLPRAQPRTVRAVPRTCVLIGFYREGYECSAPATRTVRAVPRTCVLIGF